MEKKSITFAIISCFIFILTLAIVSAAINESNVSVKGLNMSERRAMLNQTRAHLNLSNNLSERRVAMNIIRNETNMTYGACVEENAKLKNTCFENRNTILEICKKNINENSSLAQNRSDRCNSNYKTGLDTCKTTFKEAKTQCSKMKHSFIDSIRYFFK